MAFFASVCIYCYFPFSVFHIKFYRWLLSNWVPVSPWLLTHVPSLNVKLHQWSQTVVFEVNRREMKRRLMLTTGIYVANTFLLHNYILNKWLWKYIVCPIRDKNNSLLHNGGQQMASNLWNVSVSKSKYVWSKNIIPKKVFEQ